MEEHIVNLICDRCTTQFERRKVGCRTETIKDLDWWVLTNGSGSRLSDNIRPKKDLCSPCTQGFLKWWGTSQCS